MAGDSESIGKSARLVGILTIQLQRNIVALIGNLNQSNFSAKMCEIHFPWNAEHEIVAT